MDVIIYVVNDFTNEHIHKFFTEHSLVPNVNDTLSLCSVGDFVVARREFGYRYDSDYGYTKLDDITLYVYEKPKDKE